MRDHPGTRAAARCVGLLETAKPFFDFLPDDKMQVIGHSGKTGSDDERQLLETIVLQLAPQLGYVSGFNSNA